ncbi:YfiT family bacillithiol transferase [Saccharibacillus alkalitolerans]|uniref:Putative metal-dependent hydrolase GYN08_09575 n=1 Tax=Saccharibacillus alkalitolerans TaxID=2705290 RepID=A0ABX0F4H1_9BACL|nr:putative metal-dependent hydrolase [Saccharibacillus alkalitolerans]NGZ75572.1 putative metal-dependent hydrolase [Saccharibacillus alkalitolerans]
MTEPFVDETELERLRYPIGRADDALESNEEQLEEWTEQIRRLPDRLEEAIEGLSEEQLDTPYRPGGWTVRQVVHHLADSHMNAYIRLKLALTEEGPTIKPYEEAVWAEQADSKGLAVGASLMLLRGLHMHWSFLLESLTPEQRARTFYHPESGNWTRLDTQTSHYAWHGRHHTAQIAALRERSGW